MITQERQQPTRLLSWRPLFYPLGNHRGWIMELFHKEGDRYFVQVINCRDFSKITSDPVTFTLTFRLREGVNTERSRGVESLAPGDCLRQRVD
ncbi:MAG: hypothetical protein ACLFWI_15130 [Coleofasciculus sp.]|uniref:hypothetical protein n=1 Tax=Coleofasciculus sp. TaxID=3100458 RepID=UPI003A496E1B